MLVAKKLMVDYKPYNVDVWMENVMIVKQKYLKHFESILKTMLCFRKSLERVLKHCRNT